jgi:hypothetical protein
MPADETYFITWKGRRDGPYSVGQLEEMLKNGEVGLLHSVETTAGPVPLRQLLATANPAPENTPASSPSLDDETASPPRAVAPVERIAEAEMQRLYILCGWCFALPPLAWRAWQQACILTKRGDVKTAERIKWLSLGMAAGGLLLWVLLWRIW